MLSGRCCRPDRGSRWDGHSNGRSDVSTFLVSKWFICNVTHTNPVCDNALCHSVVVPYLKTVIGQLAKVFPVRKNIFVGVRNQKKWSGRRRSHPHARQANEERQTERTSGGHGRGGGKRGDALRKRVQVRTWPSDQVDIEMELLAAVVKGEALKTNVIVVDGMTFSQLVAKGRIFSAFDKPCISNFALIRFYEQTLGTEAASLEDNFKQTKNAKEVRVQMNMQWRAYFKDKLAAAWALKVMLDPMKVWASGEQLEEFITWHSVLRAVCTTLADG
jgi:hypothetical protein